MLSYILGATALIALSHAHTYNDNVTCTGSIEPIQQNMYGRCTEYELNTQGINPCDQFYEVGDRFYLPSNRAMNDTGYLNMFISFKINGGVNLVQEPCRDNALRLICYYYYPPCEGNDTHYLPPASVCQDTCTFTNEIVCPLVFAHLQTLAASLTINELETVNLNYPNCSYPAYPLVPLGRQCCSNAGTQTGVLMSLERGGYNVFEEDQFAEVCVEHLEGIIRRNVLVDLTTQMITADDSTDFVGLLSEELVFEPGDRRHCVNITVIDDEVFEAQTETFRVILGGVDPVVSYNISDATVSIISEDMQPVSVVAVAASTTVVLVALLLVVGLVVGILVAVKVRQLPTPVKIVIKENPGNTLSRDTSYRYTPNSQFSGQLKSIPGPSLKDQRTAKVSSGFLRQMSEEKLLIPSTSIKLLDCVGQGEFGIVYRAYLSAYEKRSEPGLVAVKTLKGMNSMKDFDDLVRECAKMICFNHQNVLGLIGVCIDAGEAPYLVMPFMELGSLLSYLRKERAQLTIVEGAGEELVTEVQRKLLSICLQVVSGMSYLTQNMFVHRDLAARNCMIDSNFVIKVADFGLSEDIYAHNYFRQTEINNGSSGEKSGVKLPIRWMSLESLQDGVFTEKTDVWSFGVTCWEVFSLGRTPYPAVDPFTLIKHLEQGRRLDKPSNAACSDQIYTLIKSCWLQLPEDRPSFEDLQVSITKLLEGISGYFDFTATQKEKIGPEGYDHLNRYDQLNSYDQLLETDLIPI